MRSRNTHARLRMVVSRAHHLVPQIPCAHLAIDPLPVAALVGAGRDHVGGRLGLVHQLELPVRLHRFHERVRDAHGDVEVGELAGVLGMDEALDVRMVAAQHPHLRAAAGTGRFHRLARLVEDAHVRHRTARARGGAAHQRALGADRGEVVAHAAAAAHGLGGLGERGVDAGLAVDHLGDGVAHRLHEAVDEGGGERGAGRGVDAARGNEAALLRLEEARFPLRSPGLGLGGGQRARHAGAHLGARALAALGVLFQQHVARDLLVGEGRGAGRCAVGPYGLCHDHLAMWGLGNHLQTPMCIF